MSGKRSIRVSTRAVSQKDADGAIRCGGQIRRSIAIEIAHGNRGARRCSQGFGRLKAPGTRAGPEIERNDVIRQAEGDEIDRPIAVKITSGDVAWVCATDKSS